MAKCKRQDGLKTQRNVIGQQPHVGSADRVHGMCPGVCRMLATVAIVLAMAGDVYWLTPSMAGEEGSRRSGHRSHKTSDSDRAAIAEKVAAIKKTEAELAERLMLETHNSEVALTIMMKMRQRHGDTLKTVKLCEQILKVNPKRADIRLLMGDLSFTAGQFADSIENYRKALDTHPQLPQAHSAIARSLMMLGKPDEAILEFEQEIEISPNAGSVHFLLGQAYAEQGTHEHARTHYEQALKIDPDHTNACYSLATVCARLGDSQKAQMYRDRFKQMKARDRKNLKKRKVVFDDFQRIVAGAARTCLDIADVYWAAGVPAKAEEALVQATEFDTTNVAPLVQLALVYNHSSQASKLLQTRKKIAEVEPKDAAYYTILGILSTELKLYAEAEDAFEKAIELAPHSSDPHRELALMYLRWDTSYDKARQLAQKAVSLQPTAPNYLALSLTCNRCGSTTEAREAIDRAIKLDPGNQKYRQLRNILTKNGPRK